MFPDMYVYRDSSATTHPFKFGHDYYMCEKGEWLIARQTIIIQGILLVFVFLFYGDMTKMNVGVAAFSSLSMPSRRRRRAEPFSPERWVGCAPSSSTLCWNVSSL